MEDFMKVVIFGYSDNVERYSNKASALLGEYHHEVVKINPRNEDDLKLLNTNYDTLSLYVNSEISNKFQDQLTKSNPKRVIFNPGSENSILQKKFEAMGVEVVIGCTLVMLKTNQF
jgi:hypothetical protein